jgi:hypothetical protein
VAAERHARSARLFLWPFALSLALRLGLLVALPVSPAWDGAIYARAADDIAAGRGFTRAALSRSEPFEPTAFYPVGWPATLAPLRWLGLGHGGDVVLQCLLGALIVPITALLARRAGGLRVAWIAAWLAALWPAGVLLSLTWLAEPLFTVLVGLAALCLAWSSSRHRVLAVASASLWLGLATYVRPTALPILVCMLLGVAWIDRARVSFRRQALTLAIGAGITAAVLAPWALRNADALGAPVPTSTNGGFNLLMGSYGEGRYEAMADGVDCPPGLGELEADRCRMDRAWERIRDRPGDAAARSLLRLTHTFGHESAAAEVWASSLELPEADRESARLWSLGVCRSFWLLLATLGIAGAAWTLARTRFDAVGVALLAPLAGTTLLHALVIGGDRYHAQTVPMIASFAAIALAVVWRRRQRPAIPLSPRCTDTPSQILTPLTEKRP